MHCYRMQQEEIVFLHYAQTEDELVTKQELEQLLDELKRRYEIKGCMGVVCCGTWEEFPKAYVKAEQLTEYYVLSRETAVLDEAFLKKKKQGAVQEEERKQILQYLKNGQKEDLPLACHRLFVNLSEYHIEDAKKYLKELIADVIRLSENVSGDKNESYEEYMEDFLADSIFIGQVDIEEWICALFLQVGEQLQDMRQSTSVRIMGEVTAYIEENYGDCNLSSEMVAQHYGLSVSYFSKLFNGHTGTTFPDYMNQLRLKKAKEMLLDNTDTTIQEVARQVGFNSSSYFSAAFRKYYGVSPSKIRQKNF